MASMNGYDKVVKILTTAEADVNIADKVSSLIFNNTYVAGFVSILLQLFVLTHGSHAS